MKTKTQKVLPKILPGTVHTQFIRCGKLNCKCSRGQLHGAYFYHFIRVNGKLRKRYLKISEVEEIQAACLEWQVAKKAQIANTKTIWARFRTLREKLRDVRNLL